MNKNMKAIDLYAGIGGWALGMKMAGIEVVRSFEWWEAAAKTHHANLHDEVSITDIRSMDFDALPSPKKIDVVVGSPPCTQFSYSNRGGGGDVADGLRDIHRFLQVVRYLKPKHWALENVPRVQKVLEKELARGGALEEFSDLFENATIQTIDMSKFGLPQRRKRCVAGTFDPALLSAYAQRTSVATLGSVLQSLKDNRDPNYASSLSNRITDNEPESPLDWEEARFNRDMKEAHPVYNGMAFPEPLNKPSRTVTATCTRVSRESLVIKGNKADSFRRLSVRERACLQGFPVEFQFLGKSHAEKLKMIGNAIPPSFTYFLGEAFKGTNPDDLVLPSELKANEYLSVSETIKTRPDSSGKTYPENRRFRFAIPNLRFKSGTRFELSNIDPDMDWNISFYFGDSKRIYRHNFERDELTELLSTNSKFLRKQLNELENHVKDQVSNLSSEAMQQVWTRRKEGTHPFEIIDVLGEHAAEIISSLEHSLTDSKADEWVFRTLFESGERAVVGRQKLNRFIVPIVVGAALSVYFNESINPDRRMRKAA